MVPSILDIQFLEKKAIHTVSKSNDRLLITHYYLLITKQKNNFTIKIYDLFYLTQV